MGLIAVTGEQAGSPAWYLMKITGARSDTDLRQTTITWEGAGRSVKEAAQGSPNAGMTNQKFVSLTQTLYAYGKKAPSLAQEPLLLRMQYIAAGGIGKWQPNPSDNPTTPNTCFNDGLPSCAVQEFIVTAGKILYLATDKGVFFRTGPDSPWTSAAEGLFKRSILTIVEGTQGFVYAGTTGGGVYRSLAGSTSWSALPGGYVTQPGKIKNGPSLRTSLPATTVNKLALAGHILAISENKSASPPLPPGLVLAATDNGLFRNDQSGTGWFNIPLDDAADTAASKSGAQPQSATPVLDCALTVHQGHAYIIIITDGVLQLLAWPKNIKPSKKKQQKRPAAKAAGHGLAHIPNIFVVIFDGLVKLLKVPVLAILKILKAVWAMILKLYHLIKKALEWLTHVDVQHWSDSDLPFPGSKVTFSGKFISLQLAKFPAKDQAETEPASDNLSGETFLALSTSTGIFAFDATTGKLVAWENGLPKSSDPFGTLSGVNQPSGHNNAIMLTLIGNEVFGFVPTGGLDDNNLPAGSWTSQLTLPAYTDTPAKTPKYPTIVRAGHESFLYVIRPIEFMSEWPNFAFGNAAGALDHLDVIGLKGVLAPDAVGVLVNGDTSHITPFEVVSVNTLTRSDFGISSSVSRLHIVPQKGAFDQQNYDRRSAKILVGNTELFAALPDVSETATVSGDTLQISGLVPGLSSRQFSIKGAAVRVLLLPLGGIQAWQFSAGEAQQSGGLMLPLRKVTALASLSKNLFIALTPKGVWQADALLNWKQANTGLDTNDKDTRQISLLADGTTILVTAQNLYQRSKSIDPWVKKPSPTVKSPFCFFYEITTGAAPVGHNKQLMGTSGAGLFQSDDGGQTWAQVTWRGIPVDSYVTAVVQDAKGDVFVGMDGNGLVRANAALTLWQSVDLPATLERVSLIKITAKALIVANVEGDLFALSGSAEKPLLKGLSATTNRLQIFDLIMDGDEWTAGVKGGGVIQSIDAGNHWQSLPTGINNQVHALLKIKDHWLVASAPETLLVDHTNHQTIGLKRLFELTAAGFSAELDRQLVGPKFLAAFKQAKINPPKNPCVQIITAGTSWLLYGAASSTAAKTSSTSFLIYKDGTLLAVCKNGAELTVLDYSESEALNTQQYCLLMGDGGVAKIGGWPREILPRPASKNDPDTSQLALVSSAKVAENQACTTVKLEASIKGLLDVSSVSYSANILPLAQGQLVKDEILGDSNPLMAYQSFPLRTGPLVFEKLGANTVKPILSITVNGLGFTQVENFANVGSNDRAYILTLSNKGMATVTFDDCLDGSLLAAGIGNIRATYRAKMDDFNANDTKAQYIFTEPPYGVSTMTAPVSQCAPEPAGLLGTAKNGHTHFPNRLITYADYESLALGMPDISKSKLELVTFKRRKTIFLTVAGKDSTALETDSAAIASTISVISTIGLEPQLPIKILPATMCPFAIQATLTLMSGLTQDAAEQILSEAYAKLVSAFSFTAMAIGQSVQLVTMERCLKSMSLVSNVVINGLHYTSKPPARQNLIVGARSTDPTQGADLIYLSSAAGSVTLSALDSKGKPLLQASFPALKSNEGGAL